MATGDHMVDRKCAQCLEDDVCAHRSQTKSQDPKSVYAAENVPATSEQYSLSRSALRSCMTPNLTQPYWLLAVTHDGGAP